MHICVYWTFVNMCIEPFIWVHDGPFVHWTHLCIGPFVIVCLFDICALYSTPFVYACIF